MRAESFGRHFLGLGWVPPFTVRRFATRTLDAALGEDYVTSLLSSPADPLGLGLVYAALAGPNAAPDAAALADAAGGSLKPASVVALRKSTLGRVARFELDDAWGQAEAMATDGTALYVATYHGNAVLLKLHAVTLAIAGGRNGALQMGQGRISSICMDSSRLYAVAESKGKLQVRLVRRVRSLLPTSDFSVFTR